MRAIVGILCGAVFVAIMFFVTLQETSVECAICIEFEGRTKCATVAAPDKSQAMMQAASTACASLAGGVTKGMECSRTPPVSARCKSR